MATTKLGDVCLRWKSGGCVKTTTVWQESGTKAAHFLAKMSTDVDGSPRAYHPKDKHEPDNAGRAFDWMCNVKMSDLHGIQGDDAVGPAPGYYVSATSLKDESVTNEKDARRYVDASVVPFIVLPLASFPVPSGTPLHLGCLAFVVDRVNGRSSGAIFADVGNAVGEVSLALSMRLAHRPFYSKIYPKVIGFDEEEFDERFFYLVFPDQAIAPPWSETAIQTQANSLFQAWGGEARLKTLYPSTHTLLPPDPVALPPPTDQAPLTS
jgi:hypothetical protein